MTCYDIKFYKTGKCFVFLILSVVLLLPSFSFAQHSGGDKMLILYYSMTGNTRVCCEALQQSLEADMIEIKDLNDRSGRWGFFKTSIGSLLGMYTKIEPENPDLSSYPNIILASPVWTGKLSMAIRTLIDKNTFEGKKVVIFTTTNANEKEKYKEKSKDLVREKGGDVVGYFQVAVQKKMNGDKVDKTKEQFVNEALEFVPEIKKSFSPEQ